MSVARAAMLCGVFGTAGGCVNKDAFVIGHDKGKSFTIGAAPQDAVYTLWPHRHVMGWVSGRPFWTDTLDPHDRQFLYSVRLCKGDAIGFKPGANGGVLAVAGNSECPLPDDDYGWFRPTSGAEAALEAGVLAPTRFAVVTAVIIGAGYGYSMAGR